MKTVHWVGLYTMNRSKRLDFDYPDVTCPLNRCSITVVVCGDDTRFNSVGQWRTLRINFYSKTTEKSSIKRFILSYRELQCVNTILVDVRSRAVRHNHLSYIDHVQINVTRVAVYCEMFALFLLFLADLWATLSFWLQLAERDQLIDTESSCSSLSRRLWIAFTDQGVSQLDIQVLVTKTRLERDNYVN